MKRAIILAVLTGFIFSGVESVAETLGPLSVDTHERGHEIHGSVHANHHDQSSDHGESSDHDDHFCHCGVHAVALLSSHVPPAVTAPPVTSTRHDVSFSTLQDPPLLRPPTA